MEVTSQCINDQSIYNNDLLPRGYLFLTIGAHSQRGVFLSVDAYSGYNAANERYQRLQNYANLEKQFS